MMVREQQVGTFQIHTFMKQTCKQYPQAQGTTTTVSSSPYLIPALTCTCTCTCTHTVPCRALPTCVEHAPPHHFLAVGEQEAGDLALHEVCWLGDWHQRGPLRHRLALRGLLKIRHHGVAKVQLVLLSCKWQDTRAAGEGRGQGCGGRGQDCRGSG